jgi:hypothetical protein
LREGKIADEPGDGDGSRGPNAGKELPQHPLVESLRPDPAQPAKKTVVLIGLPGKSDRPGYQRLYLTTKLNYYAEFLVSGILSAEAIPAGKSPFPGHEATQVTIGRDANIQYISATSAQPVDEFDLDVRLGAQAAAAAPTLQTHTCVNGCDPTFNTCKTQCNQQTCHNTCQTRCNQNTCVNTQCNQHTCVNTQCNQQTCVTCLNMGCGRTDARTSCADFFTCPVGCGKGGGGDDTIGNLCEDVSQNCTVGCS